MAEKKPEINPIITELVENTLHITGFSYEAVNVLPTGEVVKVRENLKQGSWVLRIHLLGEMIAQYRADYPTVGEPKVWIDGRGRLTGVKLTEDDFNHLFIAAKAGELFREIRMWLRTEVEIASVHLPARMGFGFWHKPRGHLTLLFKSKAWADLVQEYADMGLKIERPETFGEIVILVTKEPELVCA